MAEEGTLAVRADVLEEAGEYASSTYTAEAYTNKYIKKAEGYICAVTRYDWKTNYASVTTIGKELLRYAVSKEAAKSAIKQSMKGYFGLAEAQTILNVLTDEVQETIKLLRDQKTKDFLLNI